MTKFNRSHGMSKGSKGYSPVYTVWVSMKQRCLNVSNPAYQDYGGRGITVCHEWRNSFQKFYADMGDVPFKGAQIDRIDNEGDYEPGNCRWATSKENGRNRRCNHVVTYRGKTATLSEICEDLGVKATNVLGRMMLGHSLEESLAMPLRPRGRKRYVEFRGERVSVGALEKRLGMAKDVLGVRLRRGWDIERAVLEPCRVFAGNKNHEKGAQPPQPCA